MASAPGSETGRLEDLWAGDFGDAYIERNTRAGEGRGVFWEALLARVPCRDVLEVGCNVGPNLRWIATVLGPQAAWGVDISRTALREIRTTLPEVNAVSSPARDLPFRDRRFDLVFTAGVLIHQPDLTLPVVMSEIVRCSRRWVLALEYFATRPTEVPYHGQEGALFKRDYGKLYHDLFPELRLAETMELGPGDGFDDVTGWLFERGV